eukprot:TRINITY_DN9706_c1_g1_i1.p1 TRINITY_DN9706_c1_g1~~TRINITY_DN9706_c1_g1_i1.p1  ORF type:complete len:239 (+),score=65.26 TRINITY_DN9706_c1_g1_i1:121-837(+)
MDTHAVMQQAEEWDKEVSQQEFAEAVEYVGTSTNLSLSEAVQRRLFGLFSRATRGVPPEQTPEGEEEERWKAWNEARDLSDMEAMQAYISLVHESDPQYMFRDDVPSSEKKRLQEGAANSGGTVFEAARAGSCLKAFLPEQCNAVDEDGLTPLILSVDSEQEASVEALLAAGAAVNAVDAEGSTALHYAALLGATAIARRLIDARADLTLVDAEGSTPLDVATGDAVELLREALAATS